MQKPASVVAHAPLPDSVIALHCSGGSVRHWNGLTDRLGLGFHVHTPEYRRVDASDAESKAITFTLKDEAEPILSLIDQIPSSIHLVGHSYGGRLALHIAMARPQRIASMVLYEPCAFDLLNQLGSIASAESQAIQALASSIQRHVATGHNARAMADLVDYWNGKGAWSALNPEQRDYLILWAPTAILEFDALLNERIPLHAYQQLDIPVRLLQGTCSPAPARMISNALMGLLPKCQVVRLTDIGHMGPVTHADYITRLFSAHIESHRSTMQDQ